MSPPSSDSEPSLQLHAEKGPATTAKEPPAPTSERGWRFWVIFLALSLALFLTALDLASISTALPSIIHDLDGTDSFAWVSSAYTLSCTAILPLSGRLADIFGRRSVMLMAIVIFAAGSAITGAAGTMGMLIAGRTIQGIGSGAIQVLNAIIIADLVPLKERGLFNSLTGATFSVASATGPFIGGAIAQRTTWRWLFYLNLPLCGIAFAVCLVFLKLRKPKLESYRDAFFAIDWIGNAMIIASAALCIIALTWAGVQYPWSSVQVVAPLVIGLAGLPAALLYDMYYASHPVVPIAILNNRTSISGYVGSFLHGLVINSVPFYLPTYFQAAKIATPILSGLYMFPTAIAISPSAIVQGILISKTGKYRLFVRPSPLPLFSSHPHPSAQVLTCSNSASQNVLGWCAMFVGVGLLTLLDENSHVALSIPFQIIAAVGFGFLYATTFTVLAPLDPTQNAAALSFLLFVRTLSSAWSIAISATILQNRLQTLLPPAFLARIPPGHDIAYSAIPLIPSLPPALRAQVRAAFADSIRLIWHVLLAFCGAGLLSVGVQRHVALHAKMDERWGLEKKSGDAEKGEGKGEGESAVTTTVAVAGEHEKNVSTANVSVAAGVAGGQAQIATVPTKSRP
ncbi:iron permease [Earliella scabrosa]|nr:iron permease [Earliella scabrosa]